MEAGPLGVFAQGPLIFPPASEVHISFKLFGVEIWRQFRNLNQNFSVCLHSPTPLRLMRSLPDTGSFCPRFEKRFYLHFGVDLEKNQSPAGAKHFKCPWHGAILIQS